ncbi:MAG: U32 family peptidase [Tissierellia bacterium]|nr:U32 family peptidase [Tissierellia bacterium]
MKDIELLAPVGSMESLYAAVENGCNAVYLGGKLFSARQYANNFDLDELKVAVEYAHLRNVKVYVTVNILLDNGEIEEALDFIKYLYEIDVDGIIVQDLGLIYLVNKLFPDLEIHGSTQMTVNNLHGALFLEELGLKRVVLAREVSINEVKKIDEKSNIELEAFIHGALCVCYSGQCLMSSILGGRSGNRGSCAQPCRLNYSIINYNTGEILSEKWNNKYLLSPKDLNTIEYIEDIVDSGIISLKIEGRMKSPEYVATIVKNYRKALDLGSDKITDRDKEDILQIFNRGFTKGLMLGDFSRDFISLERPDNRGVPSEELINRAKSYEEEKIKYPIDMKIQVSVNNPAVLSIKYGELEFISKTKSPVEKAKKLPLTKETIVEQLSKLNDTVYYIEDLDINLEDGAFMSLSEINGLRRDGIVQLDQYRKNFNHREKIDSIKYQNFIEKIFKYDKNINKSKRNISIKVSNEKQFQQLDLNKLDRIYIGFYDNLEKTISMAKAKNKEVYLWTDKILYEEDLSRLMDRVEPIVHLLDGISVSNIGTLKFIKDNFNTNIHGDIGLNVFNSFTAKLLKEHNISSLGLSPELNMNQIENLCNNNFNSYEAIGYGYLPLMTTEYCPMSNIKNCKDDTECDNCLYRKGYGLRDRMNIDFYMERKNGTTTIYNSVPLMVLDTMDRIYNANVDTIRLDFTFENQGIGEIQSIYYDYAKGIINKDKRDKFIKNYRNEHKITKGHYFRGVL